MNALKVVWCEVKSCPHLVNGQCFADELHLGIAWDSIGFYCITLLNEVTSTTSSVSQF